MIALTKSILYVILILSMGNGIFIAKLGLQVKAENLNRFHIDALNEALLIEELRCQAESIYINLLLLKHDNI